MSVRAAPPRALTIAGSDSGGGAGIQADLKTFAAWGVYGSSAITAVTAQNTETVKAVKALEPELVAEQIDAVLEDIGCDAIKIGMLANEGIVATVADRLKAWPRRPTVLDPVMISKSGAQLLVPAARAALKDRLLPLATLVTPNVPEAEDLLGRRLEGLDRRLEGARELARAGVAVLLKGGHDQGDLVQDVMVIEGRVEVIEHPRIRSRSTHGTGCTLSSAIAANLALGRDLNQSIRAGIDYVGRAIAGAFPLGHGHGPVNHFVSTGRGEEAS